MINIAIKHPITLERSNLKTRLEKKKKGVKIAVLVLLLIK
jgi:hypothetical protein